eukprot:2964059-Rhodomonas_salina.1
MNLLCVRAGGAGGALAATGCGDAGRVLASASCVRGKSNWTLVWVEALVPAVCSRFSECVGRGRLKIASSVCWQSHSEAADILEPGARSQQISARKIHKGTQGREDGHT